MSGYIKYAGHHIRFNKVYQHEQVTEHTRHTKLRVDTPNKNTEAVVKAIETDIYVFLRGAFIVVFDRLFKQGTMYLVIYATYLSTKARNRYICVFPPRS